MSPGRCHILGYALSALLFGALGCTGHSRTESGGGTIERSSIKPAPVSLNDFKGKAVLLTFGATWCPMCTIELRELERVHHTLAGEGLQIVAVLVDDDAAKVAAFARDNALTFPVLTDPGGALQSRFSIGSLPVTVALDAAGLQLPIIDPESDSLVDQIDGPRSWDKPKELRLLRELLQRAR